MATANRAAARRAARGAITAARVTSLPVDVDELAAGRGLSIDELPDFPEGHFGALARRPNSNRFGILISPACPTRGHRRFTVGHEIGHYVMEGHLDALFGSGDAIAFSPAGLSRKKDPLEIEADIFAAELILPHSLVRHLICDLTEPTVEDVCELSAAADSSVSAAAIAFANAFDEPLAAIVSQDREVKWVALSDSLAEHDWASSWAIRGEWAPPGSATADLANSPDRISRGERREAGGLLPEWFGAAPSLDVVETAMGLGAYGRVLTVLTVPELQPPGEVDDDWA